MSDALATAPNGCGMTDAETEAEMYSTTASGWVAEIQFGNDWVPLKAGFPSRDDAEWSVAMFKMKNGITNDSAFRYRQLNA